MVRGTNGLIRLAPIGLFCLTPANDRIDNTMAAPAEVISDSRASAISLRWIINRREDLVWFIGSVLSSYALLLLYIKGLVPLVPMVALWAILIDAPHVFGTFSRTYFDRTERRNRSRLLWSSLLFFAVGPLMVYLGAGIIFFFWPRSGPTTIL